MMQLPLTSIQDAWGVSSLEDTKPLLPKKSQDTHLYTDARQVEQHPHYIGETTRRLDVALFDPQVVAALSNMSPQARTSHITRLLLMRNTPNTPVEEPPALPPQPLPIERPTTKSQQAVEFYRPSSSASHPPMMDHESVQLWGLVTVAMIFILVDKLVGIWKNS